MAPNPGIKSTTLLLLLQLFVVPAALAAVPAAPSGLSAVGTSTAQIDLSWSDNSGNEIGFNIERAPDVNGAPGAWVAIDNVASNVRSYSNTGLAYGTRYWYRVRAYNRNSNSAYSNSTSASSLTAVSLRVTGYPASIVAGTAGTLSVTAVDAKGNVAVGYPGTIRFSSSDPQATLPAGTTIRSGSGTFSATLKTAGTQGISVQDAVSAAINGSQGAISVSAASAARLTLAFPASVVAGSAATLTVRAYDSFNNVADGYRGTITFSSASTNDSLPAQYTFVAGDTGTRTFSASLNTAGNWWIKASDVATPALSAMSGVVVSAGPASQLVVKGYPANTTAGTPANFTVSALDSYGNVDTGYAGTVRFSSSDPQAVLPSDRSLISGTMTFSATLKTAGTASINATDVATPALSGTQGGIVVSAGSTARLAVQGYPATTTAGATADFTVAALDSYGNVATGYTGTVRFSSSDPRAVLPGNSALDAGTKTFSASLGTAGTSWINATDVATPALSASQEGIVVTAGPVARLAVHGLPATLAAGMPASFTVTAFDSMGNIATSYTGTVRFSSSDPQAVLPADSALIAGTQKFTATFNSTGSQGIVAEDAVNVLLSGSQSGIGVTTAPTACVGGLWKNGATQQIVHAGPGLREPPVGPVYGNSINSSTQTAVMPNCAYFQGPLRLPIFMVDWSDYNPATDASNPNNPGSVGLPGYVQSTPAELDAYVNGPNGAAQYFKDVSGGKADLRFDVFGWVSSAVPGSYLKPRADYITYSTYYSTYQCDVKGVFRDTLRNAIAYSGVDLRNYDADGNGVLDGAVLMYEGQGGLCNGGNLAWLSGSVSLTNPPTFNFQDARNLVLTSDPNIGLFANQNSYVEYFNNLPERVSGSQFYYVATWVHEIGHLMLGYPDYYYTRFNIGNWALSGNHQDIPTHPAAFEKWMFAHWIEPQLIEASGYYALAANEIPDGSNYDGSTYLYRIVIDGDPKKFITIENRWFDSAGNAGTRWARSYGRESGLQIVEFNLGVTTFSTTPAQVYRNVPARTNVTTAFQSYRPGDSFSKCYDTMCVTIDEIGAPGPQTLFAVKIDPR